MLSLRPSKHITVLKYDGNAGLSDGTKPVMQKQLLKPQEKRCRNLSITILFHFFMAPAHRDNSGCLNNAFRPFFFFFLCLLISPGNMLEVRSMETFIPKSISAVRDIPSGMQLITYYMNKNKLEYQQVCDGQNS